MHCGQASGVGKGGKSDAADAAVGVGVAWDKNVEGSLGGMDKELPRLGKRHGKGMVHASVIAV